ncbi:glutathione hydrolase 1 proenzyme-like [Pimephales promelas]|uniref:glutathione hydrolase 1 proenzyme-like n=1 Tax=Pimephales promelas TaxID=90988 RepID=UPI00195583C1|nr:glutathione hydrolase 1 proenzyme-like [Pimephales promelas]KAG1955837.1 glutathione hydrolase 1 proenzyme [Pimephales promelas]
MIALVVLITVVLTVTLIPIPRPSDKCYSKAAVAADAGRCSEIGRDMLKRGGSAVDAAIAALLCMSLYNPQSMGIGGGVVFTIYNASTGNVETIDARETAPRAASENMFENEKKYNTNKALYIAVPGELRGYEMAHQRHGRLPWKELFEPSIKLVKDGILIGKPFAEAIEDEERKLCNNALCEMIYGSKSILKENDSKSFSKLAITFKTIAEEGAKAFYDGSLTDDIVKDIMDAGGIIAREDLINYKAVLNEHALNFTLRNYTFHAPTAPFGGPVLALILNILEGYNFTNSSVSTPNNKNLTYHRIIEAFHFADVAKSNLGDPLDKNITEVVLQIVQKMTSVKTAADIRAKINDSIKRESYDYPWPGNTGTFQVCSGTDCPEDSGTSHLSIIDEYGNAVAVTSSINDEFGSRVMSKSTGIVFNNQMDDFTNPNMKCVHSKNNFIKPGKRPLSSMCPTIILDQDKKVKMVVGGAGGTNITTAVAQVIMNYLYFGYNLPKAVREPRVQTWCNKTFVDKEVIKDWEKMKHEIKNSSEISVVQAIVREGDSLCAESDYRKGGYPAGY